MAYQSLFNQTTINAYTGYFDTIRIRQGAAPFNILTCFDSSGLAVWKPLAALDLVTSVTGTANQIIAMPTQGDVILSTPQDIATTSNVNFGSIAIGDVSSRSKMYLSGTNQMSLSTNLIEALRIGSDQTVTIPGNFVVNGTSTTVNSSVVEVADNIITVGADNPADSLDLGFCFEYVSSGTKYGAIYRGSGSDEWFIKNGITTPPGNTVIGGYLANLNLEKLTANQFKLTTSAGAGKYLISDASGNGTWTTATTGVTSLQGVANQVLVNGTSGSPQTGVLTVSLPQSINTTSSPVFNSLTLNGQCLSNSTGTLSAPNYSFFGNSTYGMYYTANSVNLASNGVLGLSINSVGNTLLGNNVGIGSASTRPFSINLASTNQAYHVDWRGTMTSNQSTMNAFNLGIPMAPTTNSSVIAQQEIYPIVSGSATGLISKGLSIGGGALSSFTGSVLGASSLYVDPPAFGTNRTTASFIQSSASGSNAAVFSEGNALSYINCNNTSQLAEQHYRGVNGSIDTYIYCDSAKGRIGTSSAHPFEVVTSNAVRITTTASGNVGIGVVPTIHFQTADACRLGSTTNRLCVATGMNTNEKGLWVNYGSQVADVVSLQAEHQSVSYRGLTINPLGGNVGINMLSVAPAHALDVNGNGRFSNSLIINDNSTNQTSLLLSRSSAYKWQMGMQADNSFFLYDSTLARNALQIASGTMTIQPVSGITAFGNYMTINRTSSISQVYLNNPSTTNSYSVIGLQNNTGNALSIFQNGSTRAADGGNNCATIRNDAGSMRLQDNSSTGISLTSGTATFDVGAKFPTSGGTASTLNHYEALDENLGFGGVFDSILYPVNYTRVGRNVTLQLPDVISGLYYGGAIVTSSAMPARFRPSITVRFIVRVLTGGTIVSACMTIATTGVITVSSNLNTATGFSVAGNVGFYSTSLSYSV